MDDNDKILPNNDDEKVEIKVPNSDTKEKVDDESIDLFEKKIKIMLRDSSRIYNGRSNALIFRSDDTDLQLFRGLCNETTPIVAFTLNSQGIFEFLYLYKES